MILAVAGITEFLIRIEKRDWLAAAKIFAAAVVGGICGALTFAGVGSIEEGVAAGLTAAGIVTVATRVG